MEIENITKKLQLVFQTLFDDETIIITNDLSAKDIQEWDSLNNIMLFVEIEKIFNIHFRTSEITKLQNVGELIRRITHKLSDSVSMANS